MMGSSSDAYFNDSEINGNKEKPYEIHLKFENPDQLQIKYSGKTLSLSRMLEEKDDLHHAFCEETTKLRRIAHEHIKRVLDEQEMLNIALENKKQRLDSWSKELNKREVSIERRERLAEEKIKKRNIELQLAYEEQRKADERAYEEKRNTNERAYEERRKADERLLRLLEEQRRQNRAHLEKLLECDRNCYLDEWQQLQMKIDEIKGEETEEVKHMGDDDDDDDAAIQRKIDVMHELWREVFIKLIAGLSNLLYNRHVKFGLKRKGEIDQKALKKACKMRFQLERAQFYGVNLCSLWQEILENEYNPFKIIIEDDDGNAQRLMNMGDKLLQGIKDKWGYGVHDAVTTALQALQEYNPSGCYVLPVLSIGDREASLEEVITYIVEQLDAFKRM